MKQPRVPEYRESEGIKAYIKPLILFLKDFTMAAWTANNQRKKEIEEVKRNMPEIPEVRYPVTSVNGKTGDVKLEAGDVGALGAQQTAKDSEKLGGAYAADYARKTEIPVGLPAGGAEGQALRKASGSDHDVAWGDIENGLSVTLLWENASPTSSFSPQTISMDLSGYDMAAIETYYSTEYNFLLSAFGRIEGKDILTIMASGRENKVGTRGVTVSETGFVFSYARYGGAENNTYCVPVRIYGIKGVG